MKHQTYGYVRVSTREQNEDRQLIAMKEFHVPEHNIFIDKLSGKDFYRPRYLELIKKVHKGDLIVVKSIDRLGRNYNDIKEQWRILTREKEVDLVVLDMPLLDTRQGKDLLGTLISDIVLQLLSFVAQSERENIRQRQAEGIRAAKLKGVRFGRPPKPLKNSFTYVKHQWQAGQVTAKQAAAMLGICERTFFRKIKAAHSGGASQNV